MDATYKLNNKDISVYALVVKDGNGETEIACVWLPISETM